MLEAQVSGAAQGSEFELVSTAPLSPKASGYLLAFQRRGVRLFVALGSGSGAALLVRFEDQVGGTKLTFPASCILL